MTGQQAKQVAAQRAARERFRKQLGDRFEEYEERAAIIEYDANKDRIVAEMEALGWIGDSIARVTGQRCLIL